MRHSLLLLLLLLLYCCCIPRPLLSNQPLFSITTTTHLQHNVCALLVVT
jgi:hypothetical protein